MSMLPSPKPKMFSGPDIPLVLAGLLRRIIKLEKQKLILDAGNSSVTIATVNTITTATVTFNRAFENPPITMAIGIQGLSCFYSSSTTTQATFAFSSTATGSRGFNWFAYDPT